jgi:methyltransferase (TIGR00027 family)
MKRTEADSWDLASSVGATATMVAAARALASKEENPLISDPYAEALVRAVGIDFFTKLVDGEVSLGDGGEADAALNTARLMTDMMAVRTRFFDDFFLGAGLPATSDTGAGLPATSDTGAARTGVRQAVILASGLDSRAYRLPWPGGTTVYEIDQPQVIGAKTAAMAEIGASPTADLRPVAVDLRDDWPAALRDAGFDATQPTAWSAEGLLVYLPPDAQDRLFDNISALSAPESQLATEYHPDGGASIGERARAMRDEWGDHGFDVNIADLFYAGERTPVADYLTSHGWQVSTRTRPDMFKLYDRPFPESEFLAAMRNSLSVTAIRK